MSNIPTTPLDDNDSDSPLAHIKQIDPDGKIFWLGRDLVPILGYANWNKMNIVICDVYSSFCMENSNQNEIVRTSRLVKIGHGAIREIEDWCISPVGIDRILSRIASHKPQAVRELRRQQSKFRIEIDLGAYLYDFCDTAGLTIDSQYPIDNYFFDYCVEGRLLIEVDESHHRIELRDKQRDKQKNDVAERYNYKLLRIKIPFGNISKLYGTIFRLLTDSQISYAEITQDLPKADDIKKLERAKKKRLESGKKKTDE